MKKVVIINSGIGNVQSVFNAVLRVSSNAVIVNTVDELMRIDISHLILPGVGAVGEYLQNLKKSGFDAVIKKLVLNDKIPLLGICVGMHALATTCFEFGTHDGMDLIPGKVKKIDRLTDHIKLPHVGWNQINISECDRLVNTVNNHDFYFVHSYHFDCESEFVIAHSEYGIEFASIIGRNNIFGVQFHPEKSSLSGEILFGCFIQHGRL
tara:strand:+ start:352 stop:978 length:627 start_codon:yes stop_codon:yes gene_type:complete